MKQIATLIVIMITSLTTFAGTEGSVELKVMLIEASARAHMAGDSLLYPGFPNRIEGICYRLGRFSQALQSASSITSLDKNFKFSEDLSVIAIEAEKNLAKYCGPIASQNPTIVANLSSEEKINDWISLLEKEIGSAARKLSDINFSYNP